MRVALLGASGQLGSDLQAAFAGADLMPFTETDFDVRDTDSACKALQAAQPDVVVNTTAYHKVEDCELHPEIAFAVNTIAAGALAGIARGLEAGFVHVSTDYVFGGDCARPISEVTPPAPVQVYGVSKAAGEVLVRLAHPQALVVRTSGLFGVAGAAGKGGNFIQTVLRLAREKREMRMVNDQTLSPTYTADLAETIVELVARRASGIVHVTNSDSCTWCELAAFVVDRAGIKAAVRPCSTAEIGSPVRRPEYSVLENSRLREMGMPLLRPWQDAVGAYLKAKGLAA